MVGEVLGGRDGTAAEEGGFSEQGVSGVRSPVRVAQEVGGLLGGGEVLLGSLSAAAIAGGIERSPRVLGVGA